MRVRISRGCRVHEQACSRKSQQKHPARIYVGHGAFTPQDMSQALSEPLPKSPCVGSSSTSGKT
jgi:hypothetical protein